MVHVASPDHAPFRDGFIGLSTAGHHLLRSTYLPNLKSITPPTKKIRNAIQNIENGLVWGSYGGHSKSLEIAPFDTAHASSYLRSIVTMFLSCTVLEITGGKSPIVTYATSVWPPCWG